MLSEFITKKMKQARYKLLGDGSYYGEIPGVAGVWANADHLEDCRKELQDIFEEWILLKIRSGETISGFSIKVDRRSMLEHA